MSKRNYALEVIQQVVNDEALATELLNRLTEEGLLHLGYGDADIDLVLNTFVEVFGNTKTTRYDRFAANRLVKKYGGRSVAGIIKLLGGLSGHKYAPVVSSVSQLETKWVAVMAFIRKESQGPETIQT